MESRSSALVAVVVVNGAIALIQWFVRSKIPTIGYPGQTGIYMILLPTGFGVFGWDLSHLATAPIVVLGLVLLLLELKRQAAGTGGTNLGR